MGIIFTRNESQKGREWRGSCAHCWCTVRRVSIYICVQCALPPPRRARRQTSCTASEMAVAYSGACVVGIHTTLTQIFQTKTYLCAYCIQKAIHASVKEVGGCLCMPTRGRATPISRITVAHCGACGTRAQAQETSLEETNDMAVSARTRFLGCA